MRYLLITLTTLFLFNCAAPVAEIPSTKNGLVSSGPYKLMAGDEVELIVTQRPDLSGSYTLDPEGSIFLPVAGTINLNGLTQPAAEDSLYSVLNNYYSPLSMILKVKSFQSSEYFVVMGEVKAPGVYPVSNRLSLIKAIGMAQGFTREADMSKVELVRNSPDGTIVHINFDDFLSSADFGYDYIMETDDVIYVPRKKFFGAMHAVSTLLPLTQLGILTYLTLYQASIQK